MLLGCGVRRAGGQLTAARRDYEDAKQLDEALFGNRLDAA